MFVSSPCSLVSTCVALMLATAVLVAFGGGDVAHFARTYRAEPVANKIVVRAAKAVVVEPGNAVVLAPPCSPLSMSA